MKLGIRRRRQFAEDLSVEAPQSVLNRLRNVGYFDIWELVDENGDVIAKGEKEEMIALANRMKSIKE